MLSNFKDKAVVDTLNLKGIKDGREAAFELNIHHGTNHLGDVAHW